MPHPGGRTGERLRIVAISGAAGRWAGVFGGRVAKIELRTRLRIFARARIRNSDIGLIVLSAVIGGLVGLGVVGVQVLVRLLHSALFGVAFDAHLSERITIAWWRILGVPAVGGLLYGGFAWLLRRWRPGDIVDAIEANALYGGRMSLLDSLRLTVLTVLSAGIGASVGLEAAYTQLGSGIASRIGGLCRLRRADLRTFVGCGAAAAIAAAFNAPLAGAFYAFELIIGSYTLATLAPVALAALTGVLVERQLFGPEPIFLVYDHIELGATEYILLAGLGVLAGALGIAAMTGVTFVEGWSRRLEVPSWLRPAAGGVVLGGMAVFYPEILGSGHGGIVTTVSFGFDFVALLGLIVAKLFASALSIGSGFRGGMFSSSLFLGSLFGSALGSLAASALPSIATAKTVFILAGMGAVAASVVGAPVTMILLVLEATADFSATIGVTAAVIVASFTTRHLFGYSFATWRFHLRGVALTSPHDVGWLQDLTVGRLMRHDARTVPHGMSLRELRTRFPVGGSKYAFAVDETGQYAGIIETNEVNGTELDPRLDVLRAADLAHGVAYFLLPAQPVRVALDLFVAADVEVLPVLAGAADRRILGYLTEAYALRRYNRELEARRREEIGEDELFSPTRSGPE